MVKCPFLFPCLQLLVSDRPAGAQKFAQFCSLQTIFFSCCVSVTEARPVEGWRPNKKRTSDWEGARAFHACKQMCAFTKGELQKYSQGFHTESSSPFCLLLQLHIHRPNVCLDFEELFCPLFPSEAAKPVLPPFSLQGGVCGVLASPDVSVMSWTLLSFSGTSNFVHVAPNRREV